MLLLLLIVLGGVLLWLKIYTNHGQQKTMDDYIGQHFEEASRDAKKQSFQMIIKDSIHKVNQPGGLIIAQNPGSGSKVKENRKIYVDVTKYEADEIDLSELSGMYGGDYNTLKAQLAYRDINTKIRGYQFDPGEPDYVLQTWYKGRVIEGESGQKSNVKIKRGDTLEFILTKIDGGSIQIPDLVCMPYGQLGFLLSNYNLKIGSIEQSGAITDNKRATVIAQEPAFEEGKTIPMGSLLKITLQQEKPVSCQ